MRRDVYFDGVRNGQYVSVERLSSSAHNIMDSYHIEFSDDLQYLKDKVAKRAVSMDKWTHYLIALGEINLLGVVDQISIEEEVAVLKAEIQAAITKAREKTPEEMAKRTKRRAEKAIRREERDRREYERLKKKYEK